MDRLTFRPLTRADAEDIVSWRYDGDYSMYDIPQDQSAAAVEDMVDSSNGYFGVHDGAGLIGFVSVGTDGRVPGWDYDNSAVDVGAGLRPELTGRGHGARFLEQAFEFAEREHGSVSLRATIASWNLRAMKAAERNGFIKVASFERPDGVAFTVLERR